MIGDDERLREAATARFVRGEARAAG